jgi:hypothetical protein
MSPRARLSCAQGKTRKVSDGAFIRYREEFNCNHKIIMKDDLMKAQMEYAEVTRQEMKTDGI